MLNESTIDQLRQAARIPGKGGREARQVLEALGIALDAPTVAKRAPTVARVEVAPVVEVVPPPVRVVVEVVREPEAPTPSAPKTSESACESGAWLAVS